MKAEKWLEVIKDKPVIFGVENGFTDLRDVHNDWLKMFLFSKEDLTLQGHRGSYKTTCLAIAIALMIVLFPGKNIIFIRKSDNDVIEIVKQIGLLLESEIFNSLSYALYGTGIQFEKFTAFEISTNLKTSKRGAPQLLGLGSKGSITGKHADIVFTDDIINIQDRISRSERERTKVFYQELQNVKNRGGRIINTGTPWHKEDAFSLMGNVLKYSCYDTGLMNDEEIAHLKSKMTSSLFAANYELKHVADDNVMFSDPFYDEKGEFTYKIIDGIAHIDSSYGGADGSALTIIREDDDGRIYVFGKLRYEHIDNCLDDYERYRMELRAGTIYTETNGDKGYLLKKLRLPRQGYHESSNKYIKISTYLKEAWDRIVFIKGTDMEYIDQVLDYNEHAVHDDAPDSLASALKIWKEQVAKAEVVFYKHSF